MIISSNFSIVAKDVKKKERKLTVDKVATVPLPWRDPETKTIHSELIGAFSSARDFSMYILFPRKIQAYHNYLLAKIEREMKLLEAGQNYRSNIKYPMTATMVDAAYAGIYDTTLNIKCVPTTTDGYEKVTNQKAFIDWAFKKTGCRSAIMDAAKDALITGDGFFRPYIHRDRRVIFKKNVIDDAGIKKIEEEMDVKETRYPALEYIDCFNIFYDPRQGPSINDVKTKFIRTIKSKEQIFEKYGFISKEVLNTFFDDMLNFRNGAVSDINFGSQYLFKYSLDNIRLLGWLDLMLISGSGGDMGCDNAGAANNGVGLNEMLKKYSNSANPGNGGKVYYGMSSLHGTTLWSKLAAANVFSPTWTTKKKANGTEIEEDKFFEVIECLEDSRTAIMINGNIVYIGRNRLPLQQKPVQAIHFKKIPGMATGTGIGTEMIDIQTMADEMHNAFIDNIRMNVNPMFTMQRGADIWDDDSGNFRYEPFKVWQTNTPDAIKRLDLGIRPDYTAMDTVKTAETTVERQFGLNSYAMGYQNKVERSATGVSALVEAFNSRMRPMMDTLNQALGDVARHFTTIGSIYCDKKVYLDIGKSTDAVNLQAVSTEELIDEFDYEFDAQGLKTATRELLYTRLEKVISLMAQAGVDPNTGKFFANMEAIWTEYLEALELDPKNFILDGKEILSARVESGLIDAKAQQKVQSKLQPNPKTGSYTGSPYWKGNLGQEGAPGEENGVVKQNVEQNIPQVVEPLTMEPGLEKAMDEQEQGASKMLKSAYQM